MLIIKGNVIDSPSQVIAHQVNCMGVMGSGVARSIRSKYPNVYKKYIDLADTVDDAKNLLGQAQLVKVGENKYIANLFGQFRYGYLLQHTDYKKLELALINLRDIMIGMELTTLSFPYLIGCGLGGGDPKTVITMINKVFADTNIIYDYYELKEGV
jgi:O-acetyl-ADP-ribose deacetylase (regulator of RNase III)